MSFQSTSVMHEDIGQHEHEVTIYDSYETYAVCNLYGMHDWSQPKEDRSLHGMIEYFKDKYPKNKVEEFDFSEED